MKRPVFVFKVLMTLLFIALGYWLIDVQSLVSAMSTANWQIMIAAFACVLLIRFLMALRWKVFLNSQQIPIRFSESVSVIFASGAVGFFSPGGILADVFKGHNAYQREQDAASVASIVFVDKFVGIFSMILLVGVSSLVLMEYQMGEASGVMTSVALVSNLGILFTLVTVFLLNAFGDRLMAHLQTNSHKLVRLLVKLMAAFLQVSRNRRLMLKALVISIVMQLMRCVTFYFILLAIGLSVGLLNVVTYFPIVFMSMLLPVTVGGLGVREGATFLLFQPFGVNLEMSVASGLLFYAIQASMALIGLIALLGGRHNMASPGETDKEQSVDVNANVEKHSQL